MEDQMNGQATPEQVESWKKQFGTVIAAQADDNIAYFKKPSRQQLSYAMSLQQQNKTLEMIEHIIKSCYIAGSEVFVNETDYMLGAAGVFEQLVNIKQVEIKNL